MTLMYVLHLLPAVMSDTVKAKLTTTALHADQDSKLFNSSAGGMFTASLHSMF
jgi:hypothetical protein